MTTAYATNATGPVIVRDCEPRDLDVVHALHVDAVLHSTAIWQEVPHPRSYFDGWLAERQADGYPVIVAEVDGQVAGYATYSQWRPHQGYRLTVEHSVYVVETFRGRGIATTLMAELVARATAEGRHVMMAGICSTNTGSIALHERLGFTTVAVVPEVGRKFDRWLDLTMMRLPLV
ncbi:GNAT family N-acetyltransferase [Curtobacterium flaccumfaciens pv. flaccumfaciens]|uniref:GNAT family N-acetyltransferase n=1 Tax=Curtobacterium TaxID=2034 RepID=UPI001E61C084|nr:MULTISPECIES: GNAT family N-acetyltransferase [Curtobacterium]MCE0457699.1 N-acetyltransferase family protein [Curtobacterium allii]MCS5510488.1 GNAT family N-acetyltransferase [Curtobacterium flaccumfaciens pv. flaccumfaciens]MCX2786906.1 GNAT family N-acetyltransferase [Curtobacterium flaccumfaciens pv. flaccumfaciens]